MRRLACLAMLGCLIGMPLRAATPEPEEPPGKSAQAPSRTKVAVVTRGFLVVNMNYNFSGLFPGSQATFPLRPAVSEPQFFISPPNSVLGIDLRAGTLEGAEILCALSITLPSP